jgi:FkbM family methyltransferase
MLGNSKYVMRFLDLVLTDPQALVRHKLSRLVPTEWVAWATWFGRHRDLVALSQSQCAQDLFAMFILETRFALDIRSFKGTFVEFGAFDGLKHANTYSFERLGWKGIVLEPDSQRVAECRRNRQCEVMHAAVVGAGGADFVEFLKDPHDGELSHIAGYGTDRAKQAAVSERVSTITLDAVLSRLGHVDFLSMDTEGSEADILETTSFSVRPRIIVVEHNYEVAKRDRIRRRLESLGYERLARSGDYFDDYYAQPR